MLMTSIIGKKEYSHKVFDSFSQGASVVIIYTCGTKNISLNNDKNVACFELNMARAQLRVHVSQADGQLL